MDNAKIDEFIKMTMADSKLEISNPLFEGIVMDQILLENRKLIQRRRFILNIMVFVGVELLLTGAILMMAIYLPGFNHLSYAIRNSLPVFQKIGNFVIQYDYLIFTFLVILIFDRILNRKVRVAIRS